MIIKANTIKGRIKWNVKNRFKVGLLIENPPQIHSIIDGPIYGIVQTKLVIIVAPQNDIWPHGNTYPIKAVAIVCRNKITPTNQGLIKL